MDAPGVLYNTGTNIGSRAETVHISNNVATTQWYTETIYSRNRDVSLWKYPSKYVVPLSRTYKRVLEVELLAAEFPRSMYVIEAHNAELGNTGNNSFRFGEGYIIDDGSTYGIGNDRLQLREYTNDCSFERYSTALFPRTLNRLKCVSSSTSATNVTIQTRLPHNMSLKHTPIFWLLDYNTAVNGKYTLVKIIDACTIIGSPCNIRSGGTCSKSNDTLSGDTGCCHFLSSESSNGGSCDCTAWSDSNNSCTCTNSTGDTGCVSSSSSSWSDDKTGWLHIPRVETPNALANMVQDYLNECSDPPILNRYSVTFNVSTGRFVFDRSFGSCFFDVLSGSDARSIFPTMGFSAVDYIFGSWSLQNLQQTVLPSEAMTTSVYPMVVSETVGESALVCIPQGNYTPSTLAETITQEMQRPLIYCDHNDRLVAQLLGQCVTIIMPPGMYTPDNLASAIAVQLTNEYSNLLHGNTCESFCGSYNMENGAYKFCSLQGAVFGLLFSKSTIGPLIGFDEVDLTGSSVYISMRAVYVPIANRRYTDSIYRVIDQHDQSTFRFLKTGQYQSPIVHTVPRKNGRVLCSTWTENLGGAAHGFQVGDLIQIDGPTSKNDNDDDDFVGAHVVEKVMDAFSFEIKSSRGLISRGGGSGNDSNHGGKCDAPSDKDDRFVASHWFLPFFIHFPGVPDTISSVVGFPTMVSGCVDYVGPNQWEFMNRCDMFLNIQHCSSEYGRIFKTHNSGPQNKYTYNSLRSFVRIPFSLASDFGLLATSSFARQKRFIFNSVDFSDLSVSIVDAAGNPVNFHGREHCFDIRVLTEQ